MDLRMTLVFQQPYFITTGGIPQFLEGHKKHPVPIKKIALQIQSILSVQEDPSGDDETAFAFTHLDPSHPECELKRCDYVQVKYGSAGLGEFLTTNLVGNLDEFLKGLTEYVKQMNEAQMKEWEEKARRLTIAGINPQQAYQLARSQP